MKDNETTVEKMAFYSEAVKKIAEYIHTVFYREDDFEQNPFRMEEQMVWGHCFEKAERLYQFFESVDEVKKMVKFINTVNPQFARELVDEL